MKKYASLNNKQCMTKASLFDLDPNEYSQGSCSYPFTFNVDDLLPVVIPLVIYLNDYVIRKKQQKI